MCDDNATLDSLEVLQTEISACRVCEQFVPGFAKPAKMDRGRSGSIMIVGIGPGKQEIKNERAFSGMSGKRLDGWLIQCGCDPAEPRKNIYCTSITKCYTSDSKKIPRMAGNCVKFLNTQLDLMRPRLVITLGAVPYEQLAVNDMPAREAWCKTFHVRERYPLLPDEDQYHVLVWPHPSPLNHWHNSKENLAKLEATFPFVRQFVEKFR